MFAEGKTCILKASFQSSTHRRRLCKMHSNSNAENYCQIVGINIIGLVCSNLVGCLRFHFGFSHLQSWRLRQWCILIPWGYSKHCTLHRANAIKIGFDLKWKYHFSSIEINQLCNYPDTKFRKYRQCQCITHNKFQSIELFILIENTDPNPNSMMVNSKWCTQLLLVCLNRYDHQTEHITLNKFHFKTTYSPFEQK